MRGFRFGAAAAVLAVSAVLFHSGAAHAAYSSTEAKCADTLAKSYAKLEASILKAKAKCHADDISGKVVDPNNCDPLPSDALAKINKAKDKFVSKVAKSCHGSCSTSSDIECVADLSCPAKHAVSPPNNATAESCVGFKLSRLDWPGPYCDSIVGHAMLAPEDLGTCVKGMADGPARALDKAVFASLDSSSALSATASKCVSSIAKAMPKAVSSAFLAAAACRDARRSANSPASPAYTCTTSDLATGLAVQAAIDAVDGAIDKSCGDSDIAALTGLCAAGVASQPTTKAEAKACLASALKEVAVEEHGVTRRAYAPLSMINATHPDSAVAYCGDGVVTAKREEHTGVGEECDGDADSACGTGTCYPPGDTFECTCDNTPRERFSVIGGAAHTDSDAGWKGASHDATHNDGYGYVTALSNCNCTAIAGASCVGTSSDDTCDVFGNMAPRCSDDMGGTQTCDERGNGNGVPDNWDCNRCDDFSINAGAFCAHGSAADETVCQSQCIVNLTGLPVVPQKPCQNQSGCGVGETCRGRCDNTIKCNTMTEGSPLPQVSAAIPVCIMLEYKTDITGTKNITTGETAIHYTTRSNIAGGMANTLPCPVCDGICVGGTHDGDTCFGRCNASNNECLVDSDCTGPGDTTCTQAADDCAGGYCSLDLRCSAGPNAGRLCRPDSNTPLGIVSHDCPVDPATILSGLGVTQPFGTVTTGPVQFPVGGQCSAPAWHNFECPCPADDPPNIGVPTQPNGCAAACDGGSNAGHGCGNSYGGLGAYTTCVGGTDAGSVCDEDSDCEGGGSCSGNPTECTAGLPSLLGTLCSVNTDCGGGGVCGDACPGGRCEPLCSVQGACHGGGRDGDPCATLSDCRECTAGNPAMLGQPCLRDSACDTTTGSGNGICAPGAGVTCDIDDDEEGLCTAGPTKFRCTGAGYTSLPCYLDNGLCSSGTCTSGAPSKVGMACTVASDCLINNVPVSKGCANGDDGIPGNADDHAGAGVCEPRPEDCYVNNGYAVGGDTIHGGGSATDVNLNAAFCTPANEKSYINDVSGFGGPSRIRRSGTAEINKPSIP